MQEISRHRNPALSAAPAVAHPTVAKAAIHPEICLNEAAGRVATVFRLARTDGARGL